MISVIFVLVSQNPVATTFDVFWRIMQPIMFLLIGAEVELDKVDYHKHFFGYGVTVLCAAWAVSNPRLRI